MVSVKKKTFPPGRYEFAFSVTGGLISGMDQKPPGLSLRSLSTIAENGPETCGHGEGRILRCRVFQGVFILPGFLCPAACKGPLRPGASFFRRQPAPEVPRSVPAHFFVLFGQPDTTQRFCSRGVSLPERCRIMPDTLSQKLRGGDVELRCVSREIPIECLRQIEPRRKGRVFSCWFTTPCIFFHAYLSIFFELCRVPAFVAYDSPLAANNLDQTDQTSVCSRTYFFNCKSIPV
jgi:hypothetical protein